MTWDIDTRRVSGMVDPQVIGLDETIMRFNRALREFAEAVIEATRGPMAPPRNRPRRIARKIAARGGRLHYPMRVR